MGKGDGDVNGRLADSDFADVLDQLEARLASEEGGPELDSEQAHLFVQGLSTGLAPLAGLDVASGMASARTFLENFPIYGLPLGDVDQRAALWLAQLLDTDSVRGDFRQLFIRLASIWQDRYPLASAQLRVWADTAAPADPRQDDLWMQAMLALARTQL